MRIAKIAETLRAQGHAVTIYKRPDGGYRITKIDGIKFDVSGNAGNDYARGLLGESLSPQQYTQRRKAQPLAQEGKQATRITSFKWRKSKVSPSKSVKAAIKKKGPRFQSLTPRKGDTPDERAQKNKIRRLRRRLKARGEPSDASTIRKRLRYSTLEEVAHTLANKSRKTAGLSYPGAIDAIADFVDVVIEKAGGDPMALEFADAVKRHLTDMRTAMADSYVWPIYQQLYKIQEALRLGYDVDWTIEYDAILKTMSEGYEAGVAIAENWGIDINND